MATFTTVMTWIIGVLLLGSALMAVARIVRGPSVLDRVVASDTMVAVVVCALGTHAALTRDGTTIALLVSLSLVGFIGAVAVARFVARDQDEPAPPMVRYRLDDEPAPRASSPSKASGSAGGRHLDPQGGAS